MLFPQCLLIALQGQIICFIIAALIHRSPSNLNFESDRGGVLNMPHKTNGPAFLALWRNPKPTWGANAFSISHQAAVNYLNNGGYDHVRGYVDGTGPLPAALTMYGLVKSCVLSSNVYENFYDLYSMPALLEKLHSTDRFRFGCQLAASWGSHKGAGGVAAVCLLSLKLNAAEKEIKSLVGWRCRYSPILTTYVALIDDSDAGKGFSNFGLNSKIDANAVLFAEGYQMESLLEALPSVAAELVKKECVISEHLEFTTYRLAYIQRADELSDVSITSLPSIETFETEICHLRSSG
jgi:hypothetical protein